MPSSRGPCRLGEFCELLRVLLRNRGCDYEWIVLDVPSDIGMKELLKRASQILPEVWRDKKHRKSLLKKLNQTRHLLKELEKFEQELRRDAGYYDKPKTASDLISDCKRELSGAGGLEDAFQIMGRYRWKKSQLQRDFSKTPVKIALTGEIFTLNEPSADLVRKISVFHRISFFSKTSRSVFYGIGQSFADPPVQRDVPLQADPQFRQAVFNPHIGGRLVQRTSAEQGVRL